MAEVAYCAVTKVFDPDGRQSGQKRKIEQIRLNLGGCCTEIIAISPIASIPSDLGVGKGGVHHAFRFTV
jgi:hypothetical protein